MPPCAQPDRSIRARAAPVRASGAHVRATRGWAAREGGSWCRRGTRSGGGRAAGCRGPSTAQWQPDNRVLRLRHRQRTGPPEAPGRVAWAQATPHMCLVLGAPIPCYPPRVALVKRNATYDDLCALPDNMVAEIIDGDLFASPRPASPHALASSMLGAALISSFGG